MTKYKITIEEIIETGERYPETPTIYEQTVTGDATLVNGVVQTVLEYNTNTPAAPPVRTQSNAK